MTAIATEIRLRAERRAGEMLAEMEKNKSAVPGKTGIKARPVLDKAPTLKEIGVTIAAGAMSKSRLICSTAGRTLQRHNVGAHAAAQQSKPPAPSLRSRMDPSAGIGSPKGAVERLILPIERFFFTGHAREGDFLDSHA